MGKFTKIWAWLKNYWRVPAVAVVAILAAVVGGLFTRSLRRPDKTIRKELAASKAATDAAIAVVVEGKELALKSIEEQHKKTIAGFDLDQRTKMAVLAKSPAATARWLTRLSD